MRMLIVVLALFTAAPVAAQQVTPPQVVELAITEFIRPGFAELARDTEVLDAGITALCAAPDPAGLEAVRARFGAVVTAWSRVEFLRFGPLMADNRSERMLFWPDRKGIGLRQVQAILAEKDRSATAAATLRQKSVAVQGLGALEFVLFGTGSDELATPAAAFRCAYAAAIGHQLAAVAGALDEEWSDPDGISRRLSQPSAEDPAYRSEREVLEELTGAMAHGIEAIRDTRLLPFLGRDGGRANAKAALFWRSGMTMPALSANFAGIADLFRRSRIAEAAAEEHRWVHDGAVFEFENAARAAALVTLPPEQALADPRQRRALDYLVILTQSLQTLLGEHLPAALGLSVGFSSLDGD